jgi:BirA family transcriptional regulator, biotin operon repressor / biotin---[acetyl-CoA-carboxylase] ligase
MEKPHSSTFDNQLIELESVDSTNNYAMGLVHEGLASDGLICLARHQWAGKGQRGKTWESESGQNLIMSLIIEPQPLDLSQQFLLSAAVSLAILDLVLTISGNKWTVKWPNDIFWDDRKAAGILIESVIQGKNWPFAVVGIGMNLNQESFSPDIPNAISLKQITGDDYDPPSFARQLVPLIQNRVSQLRKDPDKILSGFNQSLYRRNQIIALKKRHELFVTRLESVDSRGALITADGSFNLGEAEFMMNTER